MTFRGHVKNGVVVLDEPIALSEGSLVEVVAVTESTPTTKEMVSRPAQRTLYDQLESFIGAAEGLPPDLARNHDHYLHGLPKKA
ncbi:MAG TPA: hypothetical protein VFC78_18350 [Tepidisphaeraceae bacterium]|nr:hypothetical protein [Tepidisphaeraceae bacterium]